MLRGGVLTPLAHARPDLTPNTGDRGIKDLKNKIVMSLEIKIDGDWAQPKGPRKTCRDAQRTLYSNDGRLLTRGDSRERPSGALHIFLGLFC